MFARKYSVKNVWAGRIERGENLLESLTQFCKSNNIRSASITALGAMENANAVFYDQDKRTYFNVELPPESAPYEMLSCVGNASIKDGEVFCHIHVALSDKDGKSYGGHLANDSRVFACEFSVIELEGDDFVRTPDDATGLGLWKK